MRGEPLLVGCNCTRLHHLRAAGYHVPEEVDEHLDDYLQTLLRTNTAPSFYSEGMGVECARSRAAGARRKEPRVARRPSALRKYAPQMDLFGLAAYLDARSRSRAPTISPGRSPVEFSRMPIRAAASCSSPRPGRRVLPDLGHADACNCAILNSLLHYGNAQGAALVGDIPFKLVRVITQTRGSKDHWENTQETCSAPQRSANTHHSTKRKARAQGQCDARRNGYCGAHSTTFEIHRLSLAARMERAMWGVTLRCMLPGRYRPPLLCDTPVIFAHRSGSQGDQCRHRSAP